MRDRFEEIRSSETDSTKVHHGRNNSEAKGAPSNAPQSEVMNDFFTKVNEIKGVIYVARSLFEKFNKAQHSLFDSITGTQIGISQKEVEDVMEKIKEKIDYINVNLSFMTSETNTLKSLDEFSNDVNIRVSQHTLLSRSFCEIISEYKTMQEDYQQRLRERMTKLAIIVNPEANSQEIEKMISGEVSFIPSGLHRQEGKAAMEQIKKCNAEILKINKNLSDLQQLFSTVTARLHSEGDNLERAASLRKGNQFDSNFDLEKGAQKSYGFMRKYRFTIIACWVTVLLAIILIIKK